MSSTSSLTTKNGSSLLMLLLFLLALFNVCLIIAVSWFVLFLYVFFHHEGDFLKSLTFKSHHGIWYGLACHDACHIYGMYEDLPHDEL